MFTFTLTTGTLKEVDIDIQQIISDRHNGANWSEIPGRYNITVHNLRQIRASQEYLEQVNLFIANNGLDNDGDTREILGVTEPKQVDPDNERHIFNGKIIEETEDTVTIQKYKDPLAEFKEMGKNELVQKIRELQELQANL